MSEHSEEMLARLDKFIEMLKNTQAENERLKNDLCATKAGATHWLELYTEKSNELVLKESKLAEARKKIQKTTDDASMWKCNSDGATKENERLRKELDFVRETVMAGQNSYNAIVAELAALREENIVEFKSNMIEKLQYELAAARAIIKSAHPDVEELNDGAWANRHFVDDIQQQKGR